MAVAVAWLIRLACTCSAMCASRAATSSPPSGCAVKCHASFEAAKKSCATLRGGAATAAASAAPTEPRAIGGGGGGVSGVQHV
jgi:hypothetical protein